MQESLSVSPVDLSVLDCATPPPVVVPGGTLELAQLLRAATDSGEALVPWGGGVLQSLGAPPSRCTGVLSTQELRGVQFYKPEDLTLGVGAGTTLQEIQAVLAEHRQFLPLDVPSGPRATLGGLVAAALSPVRRVRYGTVRDAVIGLEVALTDGTLVKTGGRVVKNVAGYDLCKLFTGSLGTLGIITAVNVKVQPMPHDSLALSYRCASIGTAVALAVQLARRSSTYAAVIIERVASEAGCVLTLLLEGFAAAVDAQQAAVRGEVRAVGSAVAEAAATSETMGVLQQLAARRTSAAGTALLLRGALHVTHLERAVAELEAALAGQFEQDYLQLDAAVGLFYLRAQARQGVALSDLADTVRHARERVQLAGGTLVMQSAPAPLRRLIDPWGAPPAGAALSQRLKRQLDPAGVLNPGRFAYGI